MARVLGEDRFDKILLDVPCTNTGVLRRRPDARWRFSEERLTDLAGLQRRMLDAASAFVVPGGRLAYSTCSLEPEEGGDLIASWLAANEGFQLLEDVSLFPPDTQTDGIYAAALERGVGE
jgi:16S rRNA (cytosine967-C5)-methyltransferase